MRRFDFPPMFSLSVERPYGRACLYYRNAHEDADDLVAEYSLAYTSEEDAVGALRDHAWEIYRNTEIGKETQHAC